VTPSSTRLLLALVTLVNLVALPREQYIGDPVAIRTEAVNLLRTGRLGVPAEIATRMGERGQYFYENTRTGRWFSKYGVLNTLLYVPPLLAERAVTGSLPWLSPRRLAFLNAYNLALGLLSAAYLVAVVGLYTRDGVVTWGYVLSALYATFWWNYLRAHAAEIYQTLFALALFYHLVRHLREEVPRARHLALASTFLAALALVKLSFLILVPVVAAVLVLAERDRARTAGSAAATRLRVLLAAFVAPMAVLVSLLAAVSFYKFGSPLLTGYEQLAQERDVLGGDVLVGLRGFAASPRGSIPWHFPLAVLALAGYPAFFRQRPAETSAILGFTLSLLLLNSSFANWQGDACYGPRYMLPVLPLFALPAVEVLGRMRRRLATAAGKLAAAAVLVVFAVSALLQHEVNALPFFAYHNARNAVLARDDGPESLAFFARPTPMVNRDLLRYWRSRASLPVLDAACARLPPEECASMRQAVDGLLRSNYLWWDAGPPRRD
jgi:hypothetical protein